MIIYYFPDFIDVEFIVFKWGAVGDAVVEADDAASCFDHWWDFIFEFFEDIYFRLSYHVFIDSAIKG